MLTQTPQQFTGRSAELDELIQAVSSLRRGVPPQRCLINLYGAHGIGKSALLAALGRRAAASGDLQIMAITLPPVAPGLKEPPLEARQAVLAQLQGAPPADSEATADAALEAVAAGLIAAGAPLLLLVEAEPRSAPALFGWFERGLLLPLVRAEQVMAVVTSRSPLRWRDFDTRRRAEAVALGPLGLADTAEQLGIDLPTAQMVTNLTAGHPLANELARPFLSAGGGALAWGKDTEDELARQISQALYERIGPGLTPELRCALDSLATVREFALPLLRTLLAFCADRLPTGNQSAQLQTLKQLQELDLVVWDQGSLSYRVTPVIRRLIGGAMRRAEPMRFAALRGAAIIYYRQMLDEVLVSRHTHMLELLWHTLDGDSPIADGPAQLLRLMVREHLSSPDGGQIAAEPLGALRVLLADDSELAFAVQRRGSNLGALIAALEQP